MMVKECIVHSHDSTTGTPLTNIDCLKSHQAKVLPTIQELYQIKMVTTWTPTHISPSDPGLQNIIFFFCIALQWRHNGSDSVSNHQPYHCLLNRLFRRRSKKTSKLRVTGLCAGNSPETGEFPAQMASNAENVFFWWRHHEEIHSWSHSWHLIIKKT